jgi:aminoglycoside phosphotransferase (APT) family kinase protein
MLELTADNLLDYLRRHDRVGPGPARALLLGGGVSNVVFRVETPDRAFVVKQSRPQLRTRDDWFSDLDRVYREQEVMQALHPLLPDAVPEVLFADRPNYVFAMSAAPADHRVWKHMLLAGEVDLHLGERAGTILGRIHQATAEDPALVGPFTDHTAFVQLRVDPFYRRVQERRPEVAAAVEPLVGQMLTAREALCHGDYTPKNLLAHGGGFTLVDYETAHLGDPTMDLGLFLCHLVLKAFHRPDRRRDYFDLTRAFWRGYAGPVGFRPLAELQARAAGHLGACLLARIDGTSPVDYLPHEPVREAVRRLGRRVLGDRPASWEDVLGLCEQEVTLT